MNNTINSFAEVINSTAKVIEIFKVIYLAYSNDSSENTSYNSKELFDCWELLKGYVHNNQDNLLKKFIKNAFITYLSLLPKRPFVDDLVQKRADLINSIRKKLNTDLKDDLEIADNLIYVAMFDSLKLLFSSYDDINEDFFDEFKVIFKNNLIQQIKLQKEPHSLPQSFRLELLTPDSISSSLSTPLSFNIESSPIIESQISTPRNNFKPIFLTNTKQSSIFSSEKVKDIIDSGLKILDIIEDIYIAYLESDDSELCFDFKELNSTYEFLKDCVQRNDDIILQDFLNKAFDNYIMPLPVRPFVSELLLEKMRLIKLVKRYLNLGFYECKEIMEKMFNDALLPSLKSAFISNHYVISETFFNDLKFELSGFLSYELQNFKPFSYPNYKPQFFTRPEILTPSPRSDSTILSPISVGTCIESSNINTQGNVTPQSQTSSSTNDVGLKEFALCFAKVRIEDGYDSDGTEVQDIYISNQL